MNLKSVIRCFYPLLLLVIPLVLNLFLTEFQWSFFDFLVMAILLTFVGCTIEIIRYNFQNKRVRLILMLMILLFFVFLWAELSVGIINSPFSGN